MRIIMAEDDGTIVSTFMVDIRALARSVQKRQLRVGHIRAEWALLEEAAEATCFVQDEIIAAVCRHSR